MNCLGKRDERLLTTNLVGDLWSPDKFGKRDERLLTTNLVGDLWSPDKFGQKWTAIFLAKLF